MQLSPSSLRSQARGDASCPGMCLGGRRRSGEQEAAACPVVVDEATQGVEHSGDTLPLVDQQRCRVSRDDRRVGLDDLTLGCNVESADRSAPLCRGGRLADTRHQPCRTCTTETEPAGSVRRPDRDVCRSTVTTATRRHSNPLPNRRDPEERSRETLLGSSSFLRSPDPSSPSGSLTSESHVLHGFEFIRRNRQSTSVWPRTCHLPWRRPGRPTPPTW